jgi:hypothetical protein
MERPTILPCGETVCGKHEQHFHLCNQQDSTPPPCKLCSKNHNLADNEHFIKNTIAQALLDFEIKNLAFGGTYDQALRNFKELQSDMSAFDCVIRNPNELISDYFLDKRREVDLVREELIEKINKFGDSLKADIDLYEEECKLNLATVNEIVGARKVFNLEEVKYDLDEWKERIGKLCYNQDMCETINYKHNVYSEKIQKSTQLLLDEMYRGRSRKNDFDSKYNDLVELFYKHSGFKE